MQIRPLEEKYNMLIAAMGANPSEMAEDGAVGTFRNRCYSLKLDDHGSGVNFEIAISNFDSVGEDESCNEEDEKSGEELEFIPLTIEAGKSWYRRIIGGNRYSLTGDSRFDSRFRMASPAPKELVDQTLSIPAFRDAVIRLMDFNVARLKIDWDKSSAEYADASADAFDADRVRAVLDSLCDLSSAAPKCYSREPGATVKPHSTVKHPTQRSPQMSPKSEPIFKGLDALVIYSLLFSGLIFGIAWLGVAFSEWVPTYAWQGVQVGVLYLVCLLLSCIFCSFGSHGAMKAGEVPGRFALSLIFLFLGMAITNTINAAFYNGTPLTHVVTVLSKDHSVSDGTDYFSIGVTSWHGSTDRISITGESAFNLALVGASGIVLTRRGRLGWEWDATFVPAKAIRLTDYGSWLFHKNHLITLESLLKSGANQNDKESTSGYTPLHIAANRGAHEVVAVLLKFGADPGLHDRTGKTAADIAVIAGHPDIARMIQHGIRVHDRDFVGPVR